MKFIESLAGFAVG